MTVSSAPGVHADRGVLDEAILRASGITVRFGGVLALEKVDIHVDKGKIVGLVGPNGAGKSTLFNALTGLQALREGAVWFKDRDVTNDRVHNRAKAGMARTFQHPQMFVGLTVRQHLIMADRLRHQRRRLWTDLFNGGGFRKSDSSELERVDALIELLRLKGVADEQASTLPIGATRLVEVGRALASEPDVLLLDEPSAGLGPTETVQLADALISVMSERAVSMLLVEHDLDMVLGISHQVFVLDFGHIIATGTPTFIRNDEAVKKAYLGDE